MSYAFMKLAGSIEESVKDRFIPDGTCVDIEVVEIRDDEYFAVAYAAVRMREHNNKIGAIVYLLKRLPEDDGTDCMVWEIHENDGPSACFCPQSILDQLDAPIGVVAQAWRKRCASQVTWEHEHWAEDLLVD